MGPKVIAARQFAEKTGKVAAIGSLEELEEIVNGSAGTRVSKLVEKMEEY
jgi:carbamate kinase